MDKDIKEKVLECIKKSVKDVGYEWTDEMNIDNFAVKIAEKTNEDVFDIANKIANKLEF